MKLVKEHINEKFTEDSDPIKDMGIGTISKFKDLLVSFAKADEKHFIYTMYVRENYIDFWFNAPCIRALQNNEKKDVFNYLKDIIDKLGFTDILVDPELIKGYRIADNEDLIPGIVRFKLIVVAKGIIKPAEYRREYIPNSFRFFDNNVDDDTYDLKIKNSSKTL